MDEQRFDALTRLLGVSGSRKRFLAALGGIAAPALLAMRANTPVAARKRRMKRATPGSGDTGAQETCGSICTQDSHCPNQCACNVTNGLCQACGTFCANDADCQGDCRCIDSFCVTGCPGECQSDDDCGIFSDDCACILNICACPTGTCDVDDTCPGACAENGECAAQGANGCVCFLGVDTADAELVARVNAEGPGGACRACLGEGDDCIASSECCGQLVCGEDGRCRQKPGNANPGGCKPQGGSCQRDSDCCDGQAACYKGRCGEKNTDCRNDGDCAPGYRCQGGPLSQNHRRCRKNGRRRRNRSRRHA